MMLNQNLRSICKLYFQTLPMDKKIISTIVVFIFFSQANAQSTISGHILNQSGDTLGFATVKFKPDSLSPTIIYSIADSKGMFRLIIPQSYLQGILEISRVGYKTSFIDLKLISREILLSPKLTAQDSQLPEIVIKVEQPIKISGDTTTFQTEAFKRGNENNLTKLLLNMPGFHLEENGKISFNGKLIDNILIENDDLTGSNYEMIAKNLSVRGIDKIEIIKHYTDPQNITSRLSNSNKQVLNIKFKKNLINKTFGNIEGDIGTPLKYYDLNGQAISLLNKLRLVSFFRTNTIGDTYSRLINKNKSPDLQEEDVNDLTNLLAAKNSPIVSIDDITNPVEQQNDIFSNNTTTSSINFFSKPFKNFFLNGSSNFISDDYSKSTNTSETLFLFPQTIAINENKNARFKTCSFENILSLNYMSNFKNQLSLVLKSINDNMNNRGAGALQGKNYLENAIASNNWYNGKFSYNHLIGNNSALSFDVLYSCNNLPGNYFVAPSNYDSFFFKNPSDIYQSEYQKFTSVMGHINFIKKYRHHNITLTLSSEKNESSLVNTIKANSTSGNAITLNPDSTNNSILYDEEIKLKVGDVWKLNNVLSFSANLYVLYFKNSLGLNNHQSLYRYKLLPQISATCNFSKIDQLSLSFGTQNKMPVQKSLGSGFDITGLTTIGKGYDSLNTSVGYSEQVFFSHIDFLKRRFLFFSGITFQQTPCLYLPNQFPTQFFTVNENVATDKYMKAIFFFLNADKYFGGMKYKISFHGNLSAFNNYTIQTYKEYATNLLQLKAGITGHINLNPIEILTDVNYLMTDQKYSDDAAPKIHTSQLQIQSNLNWKIARFLFFELSSKYDQVYPPKQKPISIFLLDAEMMYHSKNEKWSFGLKCNNITAKTSFAQSTTTPTQISLTNYSLFPRTMLATIKFSF